MAILDARIAVAAGLVLGAIVACPRSAGAAPPNAAAATAKAAQAKQKVAAAREHAAEAREHAAAAASGNSEEAKKAQAAAKEAHEAAKDARKDAHEAAKEARGDAGMPPDDVRKLRNERAKNQRTALRAKWGDDLLRHPAVRAELKIHAWRLARLGRIRKLADEAGKKDVLARVDALMAKERARYDKRMATLKSKGGEQ